MPRYDYECVECGERFALKRSPAVDDVGSASCVRCGKSSRRLWTSVPQMIVRGTGKNKRDQDDFAPEHIAASVPRRARARGLTPKQYERIAVKDRHLSESFWRDKARGNVAGQGVDGHMRKTGEIVGEKFLAMYRENDGDMPSTDQLLRRGCIYEHEKKNVS